MSGGKIGYQHRGGNTESLLFLHYAVTSFIISCRNAFIRIQAQMQARLLVGLLSVLLLVPVPVTAQAADTTRTGQSTAQLIKPGDVIDLNIWREPEWSGQFQVDEAGIVVFPRVGEYAVLDETPESLRAKLLAAYRQYLRNPSMDVTVLRRVRIMGAIQNPGLYPVDPTITIADAIALAGGATPRGDPNKAYIIRNGEVLTTTLEQTTVIGDSPIQSGDQIFVPERRWITRNAGVVIGFTGIVVSLIIAFAR